MSSEANGRPCLTKQGRWYLRLSSGLHKYAHTCAQVSHHHRHLSPTKYKCKIYQMGGFLFNICPERFFFYLTRELELLAWWLHAEHTEQTQPFGTLDTSIYVEAILSPLWRKGKPGVQRWCLILELKGRRLRFPKVVVFKSSSRCLFIVSKAFMEKQQKNMSVFKLFIVKSHICPQPHLGKFINGSARRCKDLIFFAVSTAIIS